MNANFKNEIQTFGRSLLLPIAVLAPVGMVMGISSALGQNYMIEKLPFLGNAGFKAVLSSLGLISSVVFQNIPLLFAMGVAYGMSKKEKGIAVFASVIAYLTLLISMHVHLKLTGQLAKGDLALVGQGMVLGVQTLKIEAVGGIIAGLLAAKVTDRYYRLQLPLAFAFFSGKKSVAILAIAFAIPIGLIIPFIWDLFTAGMKSISTILMAPNIGAGIYMTLNRLLIPFGLHHVLSSTVRFTEAGGTYLIDGQTYVGILPAINKILFELGPNHPAWDQYMPTLTSYLASTQMLTTLFRVPAIGLAMYHMAYFKNKKFAKGMILTVVLTAVLGNITEPLEFSFLFIAPKLFIVYAVFRYAIGKFDIKTPGRESEIADSTLLNNKEYDKVAELVIEGLGGKTNIKRVENCVSRLRIDLNDQKKLDMSILKDAGSMGTFIPSSNHIHVVFGPHVEFVRNAVDDALAGHK